MKQLIRLLMGSSLVVLALSACTKEVPYEEKFKEEVTEKFDTSEDYLMSSSMLNASRTSQAAMPFAAGDNKRVRLEWGKTSLRVITKEKDARFKDNSANDKLVMEIPVEYVDYQCVKDKFGECTNSEEERSDIPWDQKTKVKIKAEAAKSTRLEVLPILSDNEEQQGFCYNEVSARALDLKLEKDAINLTIERTFRINLYCMPAYSSDDSVVTAIFHYSFVKTSSVLSKDFKVVSYPKLDERTFGFFSTERLDLDVDNSAAAKGEKVIMNHWNPNRSEIVYHLSDNFSKPENAKIRELTYKVVESLNDGLAQSEAKFRIKLKDSKGLNPGDIRNSMIVMVEDPMAASIIGYGPQTEDPETGEIVSARTVMYLGTIKTIVRHTYDDIINEKREAKIAKAKEEEEKSKSEAEKEKDDDNGGLNIEDGLKAKLAKSLFKAPNMKDLATAKPSVSTGSGTVSASDLSIARQIERELKDATRKRNTDYEGGIQAQVRYLQNAKNCAFGLDADLASNAISPKLAAAFADDALPWDQLSDAKKQEAMDIILPEIWVPTLIHEMGHNLGLRHNFKGSEDAANHFTNEELAAHGIDHAIPFSSVMEYADDLKALPVLGKYDIAALRFAYAQKLELANGDVVPVNETIQKTLEVLNAEAKAKHETAKDKDEGSEEPAAAPAAIALKPYGFCTDEHTGINPGCRRFDIGITLTEIVENEIKAYQSSYKIRNLRAGRAHFSLQDDPGYLARVSQRFMGLRLMQETYENLKNGFNLTDDNPVWTSNDPNLAWVKDIRTASTKAGQFLMSVVAMPDLTCVMISPSNPTQLADARRLDLIDADAISCLDEAVVRRVMDTEQLIIIGQYGKLFQSRKDPKSTNNWADQIDVRGYWLDKLAATRILFQRSFRESSLNDFTDNFADRADLAPELNALVNGLMLNKIAGVHEIEFADGSSVSLGVPVDSKVIVQKPLWSGLARYMGIPDDNVAFGRIFAENVASRMVNDAHEVSGKKFLSTLSVGRSHAGDKWSGDYKVMDLAGIRFLASPQNKIARTAMEQHELSAKLEAVELQKGRQRLIQLYLARKAKEPQPKDLTKEERIVWNLGDAVMFDYLTGALEKPAFFQSLLIALPNQLPPK